MSDRLLSIGLDIGTTSTQMVLSELQIENRAGSFAVPEMEIAGRKILYKSPVHFTPLKGETLVDAGSLRRLVDEEYRRAGIRKDQVDTGAIIITGETGRRENAAAALHALSEYAGEFVVATAGPDLESVLAARGSGAVDFSAETGKTVLAMDIGGGTSNLALIQNGKIMATACLNVGGRLVKIRPDGEITYVSPVISTLFEKKAGDYADSEEIRALAETLTRILEMAAGKREKEALLDLFVTPGTKLMEVPENTILSFSGGVAECIETVHPFLAFGDIGPELGQKIRDSLLCRGTYRLGRETIRATVIGAGCHSTQLSGSTIFCQNMNLPLKNLPVVSRAQELKHLDGDGVLALSFPGIPEYGTLAVLAGEIGRIFQGRPVIVALEQDMAKALGQRLALDLGQDASILCMDRLHLEEGNYLDVGTPVGPALPVVVKTLILSQEEGKK